MRKGKKVRVESDRAIVVADRVIVTVPPAVAARIEHSPALPALRAQLEQRVPMGTVVKCQARYPKPFWRDDGLTGQATSNTGPVKVTFDNTPPGGSPGVMLGFLEGQDAREWVERPAGERRQAVLESFARYFGDAMLEPDFYVEKSWAADEWSAGCYTGFTPPGRPTRLRQGPTRARRPHALGRHGDGHALVGLHRRRRPVRRARRGRGPRHFLKGQTL